MYELTVERTFCAAHALMISGQPEPLHGHNWHVTATIVGEQLDADGLLCDFHTVDRVLKDICRPLNNQTLNQIAPFDTVNPSAEHVASHIARELNAILGAALAPHARVDAVRVTEAEGCSATYRLTGARS